MTSQASDTLERDQIAYVLDALLAVAAVELNAQLIHADTRASHAKQNQQQHRRSNTVLTARVDLSEKLPPGMRRCSQCRLVKPTADFRERRNGGEDKYHLKACRDCEHELDQKRYYRRVERTTEVA